MTQMFIKGEKISDELIKQYETVLPDKLIAIWKEYGYGELLDGYLRIINPNDYQQLICDTYFRGNTSVPVLVTAFGDVITYEAGDYIGMVKYKYGSFNLVSKRFSYFLEDILDDYFLNEHFQLSMFDSAKKRLGTLGHDECYGFVPLLGLGGKEDVSNLKIVKTREHLDLITHLLGGIGM